MLDWPLYSLDLNPIEYLWFLLKQAVYEVCPSINAILGKEAQRTKLEEVLLAA